MCSSSARPAPGPAWPSPLRRGCPWCRSRAGSWAARPQARCWPAASRLQNRSSLFLHRPKAGGVWRCHPRHPSSCPTWQSARAHTTKERNHPHISPNTCLRLTPTNPHLYQGEGMLSPKPTLSMSPPGSNAIHGFPSVAGETQLPLLDSKSHDA